MMNIELHKIGVHECPECGLQARNLSLWGVFFGFRRSKDVISWCKECRKAASK